MDKEKDKNITSEDEKMVINDGLPVTKVGRMRANCEQEYYNHFFDIFDLLNEKSLSENAKKMTLAIGNFLSGALQRQQALLAAIEKLLPERRTEQILEEANKLSGEFLWNDIPDEDREELSKRGCKKPFRFIGRKEAIALMRRGYSVSAVETNGEDTLMLSKSDIMKAVERNCVFGIDPFTVIELQNENYIFSEDKVEGPCSYNSNELFLNSFQNLEALGSDGKTCFVSLMRKFED